MAWLIAEVEVAKEPKEFFYRNRASEEQRGIGLWLKDLENQKLQFPAVWFDCEEEVRAGYQYKIKCLVTKKKNKNTQQYEYNFVIDKATLIRGEDKVKTENDEVDIPF